MFLLNGPLVCLNLGFLSLEELSRSHIVPNLWLYLALISVHRYANRCWEDSSSYGLRWPYLSSIWRALNDLFKEGKCGIWQHCTLLEWIVPSMLAPWSTFFILFWSWRFYLCKVILLVLQALWTGIGLCWNWLPLLFSLGWIHRIWV